MVSRSMLLEQSKKVSWRWKRIPYMVDRLFDFCLLTATDCMDARLRSCHLEDNFVPRWTRVPGRWYHTLQEILVMVISGYPSVVEATTGAVSVKVQVKDSDITWRRHFDHICSRDPKCIYQISNAIAYRGGYLQEISKGNIQAPVTWDRNTSSPSPTWKNCIFQMAWSWHQKLSSACSLTYSTQATTEIVMTENVTNLNADPAFNLYTPEY